MSASLVGSEMCIRDRVPPTAKPQAATGSADEVGERAPEVAAAAASSQAVSYTHLTLPTICSV
eukprot:8203676-Alexandrium_andersonii.AAC.1